jgi:hypothetical protein
MQNLANRGLQSNNKSGFKGVRWYKSRSKWKAEIKVNYKNICLGYFVDLEEAVAAYAAAAEKYNGEFACASSERTSLGYRVRHGAGGKAG